MTKLTPMSDAPINIPESGEMMTADEIAKAEAVYALIRCEHTLRVLKRQYPESLKTCQVAIDAAERALNLYGYSATFKDMK